MIFYIYIYIYVSIMKLSVKFTAMVGWIFVHYHTPCSKLLPTMKKKVLFTVYCVWLNRTEHNVHLYSKLFLINSLLYSFCLFSQCQNWKNLYVASWRSVTALTLGYINFQLYQQNRLRALRPSRQSRWDLQSFGTWNSATPKRMNTL